MKQLLLVLGLLSAASPALSFAADAPPASAAAAATTPAPTPAAGAAAAPAAPAAAQPKTGASSAQAAAPQVLVVTSMGNFTLELNAERAPLTVAHFLKYVDQGQYSGTVFHRVIANFVIQGG
ncbi:MAG: hypothetical protein QOF32_1129, partial [Gammaproteobacteria bacterium]|nr:hypothetical protein [Gammaproteobacteria bacterium]